MDTERIPNGNGTDMEPLRIAKMEKAFVKLHTKTRLMKHGNLGETGFQKGSSSEHMLVSYAIRVLTKDLETMQL